MTEVGRRRFGIGHELGHWELHLDLSQGWLCSSHNIHAYRGSAAEIEANVFAAALLMPLEMLGCQTAERLWRQWQPNVTHNHTCSQMEQLVGNSDAWLTRAAVEPQSVMQMLGELAPMGSPLLAE